MKKQTIGLAFALALLSTAATAQERAGDAVLGAVSGAVVLGPVGAVAGAFVGYAAGPSIASSWGLRRPSHRRYARRPATAEPTAMSGDYRSAPRTRADVAAVASAPPAPPPSPAPAPAPAMAHTSAMPPVQPLE
ncbi:MAG: DNA-directed RNA polymerase subunit N [Bradyrhizobium sp.]|uniref:DNA-directed RNA polymerase subunit N n=1 Tax=Bradyrhizobium sp. TaxID=376 RepID=UPI0023941AAE|nr:DNA-directed RNA polymerase subunit N [Bradyrhizobium sp.]MDE2060804.1 DNA-directed RNA polymerase subunit N [Bradyrhizobium sp.]